MCETEGNLLFPFSFRRSERETSKAISKQHGRGRMGVFCAEAAAVFPLPSVALSQLRIKRKQGIEFENTCFLFFFFAFVQRIHEREGTDFDNKRRNVHS